MKKLILIAFLFLTACGSGASYPYGTPTATPNPGEIALQMMQQQMAANATSQVVGLNFTATAQMAGATATANQLIVEGQRTEQARVDAAATSEQKRADAQATQSRMDMDARATQSRMDMDAQATQAFLAMQATQARDDANAKQARIDAQSTADSLATATFTSMTLTAIPPHATLTQIAVDNQIVISTQEVERSALSLKQARDTNVLTWLLPILGSIFILICGAAYFYNQSQVRVEKNDDGHVDVIIYKNQKAFRPDLFATPLLDLHTNEMPMLTDKATQSEVTRGEQVIRALGAMPTNPSSGGADAFNKYFSQNEKKEMPVIEVVPFDQVNSQILSEIEGQIMEEG
jgi:hypothetical protein